MNLDQIRACIAESVGSPNVGPVAEVIDTIADAVNAALNPVHSTNSSDQVDA
jgi:hypothetical protein